MVEKNSSAAKRGILQFASKYIIMKYALEGAEIGSDHLVLLKMSRKRRVEKHRRLEEDVRIRTDRMKDRG